MPSQGAASMLCYLTSLCGTHQPLAGSRESLSSRGRLAEVANNQHPRLPRCWKSLAFFPHKSLTGWWFVLWTACAFRLRLASAAGWSIVFAILSDSISWLLLEKGGKEIKKERGGEQTPVLRTSTALVFHQAYLFHLFSGVTGGDFFEKCGRCPNCTFQSKNWNFFMWEEQARIVLGYGNQPCQPQLLPSLGQVYGWAASLSPPASMRGGQEGGEGEFRTGVPEPLGWLKRGCGSRQECLAEEETGTFLGFVAEGGGGCSGLESGGKGMWVWGERGWILRTVRWKLGYCNSTSRAHRE